MKYKRVILINPYPKNAKGINEATIYPPIGLAYIASFLSSYYINVKIIDANILKLDNKIVLKEINDFKPDLVGISLNIVIGRNGINLSHLIKSRTNLPVSLGGPLVSSNPEKILEISKADMVCVGESEITMLEICQGKKLRNIDGLCYRKGNKIICNKPRKLIEDINTLPYPAYDLLPPLKLYKSRARKKPVGTIMTSRGCPYQCTYCNSNIFGKKFRARSPENVIGEIDLLVKKYGVKQLDVLDDNFTLDIERAEKIIDIIIERKYNILINLQNGVRADRLTYNLVKKMKKAGVFKVGIGIESGDKEVQKFIRKFLDLKKVIRAIKWFRSQDIITIGFFILGLPIDTDKSVTTTIDFAIKANPSIANFCLLIPFPGTEIYEYLKENKLLKEELYMGINTGFYEKKVYHKCKYLSEEKLFYYQSLAYKKFNFRLRKIIETLTDIRSFGELKWTMDVAIPLMKRYKIFERI